jgi:MoaA/NifB/PqqE/SkfB family radical SAM enzyme
LTAVPYRLLLARSYIDTSLSSLLPDLVLAQRIDVDAIEPLVANTGGEFLRNPTLSETLDLADMSNRTRRLNAFV